MYLGVSLQNYSWLNILNFSYIYSPKPWLFFFISNYNNKNRPASSSSSPFTLKVCLTLWLIVLPSMLQRFLEMKSQTTYTMQQLLPPSGQSSQLVCLEKAFPPYSHLVRPAPSLVWLGYVHEPGPTQFMFMFSIALESVNWWRLSIIKDHSSSDSTSPYTINQHSPKTFPPNLLLSPSYSKW